MYVVVAFPLLAKIRFFKMSEKSPEIPSDAVTIFALSPVLHSSEMKPCAFFPLSLLVMISHGCQVSKVAKNPSSHPKFSHKKICAPFNNSAMLHFLPSSIFGVPIIFG